MKTRLDEWELLDCCHGDGENKFNVDRSTDFNFRSVSASDPQHTIGVGDEDAVSQVSGKKLIGDVKKLRSAGLSDDLNTDFNLKSISASDQQHKIRDEQEIGAKNDEDAVSQVSGKKLIGDMKKQSSAELSIDVNTDFNLRSISVSDQQHRIRKEQEIGALDDEDAVSQLSGEKSIGDMKREAARFRTGAESVEKRQKLGIAAICSFGIAVAATICSAVGKP